MANNYGYQNEYDFVRLFNNKHLYELDQNSQNFLEELFQEVIDSKEKILCWRNKMFQKADIYIKYKNYTKAISLKCGNSNSVHQEPIQEFRMYLEHLRIPYKTIEKYLSYHYGYKKDENRNTDYYVALSSDKYKELYQNEIDIFNESINKTRIIVDMIDRFVIYGRNADYPIDALVSGTIDDYVWILRYDLYDLILSKAKVPYTSPHASCLTIGTKKRNLEKKEDCRKDRYIVSIRWNYIRDNIIEFKNNFSSNS